MLTDKQKEVAARELCRLRGFDLELMVAHGADPGPNGFTPAILLHSPAWRRVLREIEAHEMICEAIEAGRREPVKEFEIWSEGYRATDEYQHAYLVTTHKGATFREACEGAMLASKFKESGEFDAKELRLWGCRLFDNEADARMKFG